MNSASKKQLRQDIRRRLALISDEELHRRSVAACRLLGQQPEYQHAEVVMLFLSMAQEIDTSPLALQSWSDSKRVLAPRVSWETRRMLPLEIQSLTTDVRDSDMGFREPAEGMPIPVFDIDLVIVPGLAFDEKGNRLGRGMGFYDRFLAHRDLRGISCALALEEQVVDEVPADAGDMRVDMLVTDVRVRRFKH